MTTADKVRVSLEMSPEMHRIIERLAEESGTNEADVLRRAIALLKVVKDAEQRGETPALVNKDGTVAVTITGV